MKVLLKTKKLAYKKGTLMQLIFCLSQYILSLLLKEGQRSGQRIYSCNLLQF